MEEKKYLKWYNKIGYGSGDIAGNVVYAFLTSFMMVYLTDSVGLASGVVGTLIAVSKLFDGFTDIFFGSMIDKTHSKMGKAKPWMLYGYIGCAITLVCCFTVPVSLGTTAKYAWFFISYTLLNGVFYTANNIAYSALTSLITKNSKERVQMGSYRFIFAFSTSLLIQAITVGFVDKCGGDAAAWRTVAIIYAIIGLVVNTISALSVKELPEEELNEGEVKDDNEKYGMVQAFKLLVKNKYYMMICGTYILQQLYGAMIGAGIYYMTWVLKNKNLFGQFAWAVNIPLIIALIFTPTLVGKWKGMYKLNLRGYVLAVIGRALVVVAGYMGSVPLMMAFTALAALGQGPWQGDMNAVIASCCEYTYLTQGKRIDGTMYSCTSLGVKIGGGIGTAVVGWMLELSGYVGKNATQPQSALDMMQFMYLWLPLIFDVLIMFALSRMNVEDANKKLKARWPEVLNAAGEWFDYQAQQYQKGVIPRDVLERGKAGIVSRLEGSGWFSDDPYAFEAINSGAVTDIASGLFRGAYKASGSDADNKTFVLKKFGIQLDSLSKEQKAVADALRRGYGWPPEVMAQALRELEKHRKASKYVSNAQITNEDISNMCAAIIFQNTQKAK